MRFVAQPGESCTSLSLLRVAHVVIDVSHPLVLRSKKGIVVRYRRVPMWDDAAWRSLLQGDGSLLKPYKMKGGSVATVLAVLVVALVTIGVIGVGGYRFYQKEQGIQQAQEQEQAQIAAQNATTELKSLRQEAEDLVANQDKSALTDPATLDNLSSLVASQSSSAADLHSGIKVVKASRKPASDGLSYDEWVKKADDFIAQVKADNNSKEAASIASMYPTVKNSGNAQSLKEFVEENRKLL